MHWQIESGIKEAMDELTYMSADKETRAEYDARIKELNRIHAALSVKYDEGKAEGEKIGEEKKAIEVVKNLLKMGLTIEQVAQGTGLSIEEVRKLS